MTEGYKRPVDNEGIIIGSQNLHLKGRPSEGWLFCTHTKDLAMGDNYSRSRWGNDFEYMYTQAYHTETGEEMKGCYGFWRKRKK
jgi:hypothetical protein